MAGEVRAQFFAEIIFNGTKIGQGRIDAFEWKSFVNGGYEIRASISDPGHRFLNDIEVWRKDYLAKARRDPLEIKFKMGYLGGPPAEFETYQGKYKKAIISDLTIHGDVAVGGIEFVAIDPPSWYLNAGKSDGKIFTGNVSKVIKDVVQEATGGAISAQVSETKDDQKGKWPMMRQDPKTFILSLMDWSSRIINTEESMWMVGVDDNTIYVESQQDFRQRQKHIADYNASTTRERRNDIMEYSVLNNTLLTAYQARLTTQGISVVSGKFLDKQVEPKKVEIRDENTTQKLNAKVDPTMSYKKPSKDYSTSIIANPEFSGGELGIKYEDWIGGRPQQLYLQMLPMIMRCRFTVKGDYRFYDNNNLGVATIKLTWKDIGSDGVKKDYFLHGHWIVYGFHHRMVRGEEPHWYTDIYAYRIDHDSSAQLLPG